jgi:hypothetical protein
MIIGQLRCLVASTPARAHPSPFPPPSITLRRCVQVPPFKETLSKALPFVDFLFGNETEAEAFAKSEGWSTQDKSEIALKVMQTRFFLPPSARWHLFGTVLTWTIGEGVGLALVSFSHHLNSEVDSWK